MKVNEIRAVIDTSVVVSAVLFPRSIPRQAVNAVRAQARLLISAEAITELNSVLRREKFSKYVPEQERLEFVAGLIESAELVDVVDHVEACRDSNDDKFLELAVSGKATHVISGDADLLSLNPFCGISVVTPQAFLAELAANQN